MKLFKKKEPQLIEVKGNQLCCPICTNKYFWSRNAQLNTSIASFFGLDWVNRSATCFVCSEIKGGKIRNYFHFNYPVQPIL